MEAQMAFNTWTYIDFHLIYIFIDIYNSKDMFLITTIYLFNSFKQLGRKKSKIKPKQKNPKNSFTTITSDMCVSQITNKTSHV